VRVILKKGHFPPSPIIEGLNQNDPHLKKVAETFSESGPIPSEFNSSIHPTKFAFAKEKYLVGLIFTPVA
jgi:hypothetical protein